jgi:hypothetical protein
MEVKIANAPARIKCPATYYMRDEEGGMAEFRFHCYFRRLAMTEREELTGKYLKGEITQDELLDKVMVDWDGMTAANGQSVPYSHEARRAACEQYAELGMAMGVSFFDHAQVNQREAAAKNSKPLSASTSGATAADASVKV